jgi:uncharacterized protein YebE (UPF0316 family)
MAVLIQSALLIFFLRCIDITLYTLRILMVMRGKKFFAWCFGFCQSLVFLTAIQKVLSDLSNWLNIVGYAAGFATGLVLGMFIEGKLHIGFLHMRIISTGHGGKLAETLREAGFGVTEIAARGKDGAVELLHCSIQRQERKRLELLIKNVDEHAFITAENVRPLQHGFWGNKTENYKTHLTENEKPGSLI